MVTPLFITFISLITFFGVITLIFAILVMFGVNKKLVAKKLQKKLIKEQSTTHVIKNVANENKSSDPKFD